MSGQIEPGEGGSIAWLLIAAVLGLALIAGGLYAVALVVLR